MNNKTIIEVDLKTMEQIVESIVLTNNGSIKSTEARSATVERLQYQIGEKICAIVAKDLKDRKFIK